MPTSRKHPERRGPNAASTGAGADEAQPEVAQESSTSNRGYFSLTLIAALGLALAAAVIIAPYAALATAAAGFNFPFPRIFDRVVTATLFSAMLLFAHRLKLLDLLREGFSNGRAGLRPALGGLALAAAAMSVLFGLAAAAGGNLRIAMIAAAVGRYLPAAIVIAVIEEGFFRAFLLAGIQRERGSALALLASSAIFALVHVIRSPARFYLTQFEPMAGAIALAAYAVRLSRPGVGSSLLGLFLLGLVLGEAFILTRRVYCSLGLHVGLVLGAKAWGRAVGGIIPRWLAGPGSVPVIAAPAAWVISTIMLILLRRWSRSGMQPSLNGLPSPLLPVEVSGSQPRMVGSAGAVVPLCPPGAEELADHELGVERAAYGQQLTRRAQQLGEERVRRRRAAPPLAAPRSAGGLTGRRLASSALRAHPDSLSDLDMRTLCYVVMPAVIPPSRPGTPRRPSCRPGCGGRLR